MIDRERVTHYVMELMRIDSPSRREGAIARSLMQDLEELGVECCMDDAAAKVGGDAGNLLCRLKGTKPNAPPIMLSAHMDTVQPGEGVRPRLDDGVIRSDGTTVLGGDDKAGLGVIVEVVRVLREHDLPHGDVELALTVCEEVGLLGSRHLDCSWFRSRYGIVLDSSSPHRLVLNCPASVKLDVEVHGLEAHAGVCPERGISAVAVASKAIASMRLGRIDEETTANIGIISGGRAINIIPNHVRVVGEVRSHDEEKLRAQTEHMRGCFHEAASGVAVVVDGTEKKARIVDTVVPLYEKMAVPRDSTPARLVTRAASELGHPIEPVKSGGGCDANFFNLRGIECVNLGTGMRDIHTVNEYLVLDELYKACEIVLEVVRLNAALQ